ncbi:MAG: hypothetical protein N2441_07995 [Rhodocyclaceae bacterium]|nr:hypothetical protein [Rhodocyclaceae bacterium]
MSRPSAAPPLDPGVAVGMTVFGSFLQGIFTPFEFDVAPAPAAQAEKDAHRRRAEEESGRRAAEEAARHDALLNALKAGPARVNGPASGSQGQQPLRFKALAELDGRIPAETLREHAAMGWEAQTMRLAARFKTLPVSPPLQPHAAQPLCRNRQCEWPATAEAIKPNLSQGNGKKIPITGPALIDWMRTAPNRSVRAVLDWQLMQELPSDRLLGRWQLIRSYQAKLRESFEVLAMAWAINALDTYGGTVGKGILLIKDVYELTRQDFEDAKKAAAWLGSADPDAPLPELTSLEEAAKPFLYRGITEQEKIAEGIREGFALVSDATDLAKKLIDIWKK